MSARFKWIDDLDISEDEKLRHQAMLLDLVGQVGTWLLQEMRAQGAANFVTTSLVLPGVPETFSLVLQRDSGRPPAEVIGALQAENAMLRAQLLAPRVGVVVDASRLDWKRPMTESELAEFAKRGER